MLPTPNTTIHRIDKTTTSIFLFCASLTNLHLPTTHIQRLVKSAVLKCCTNIFNNHLLLFSNLNRARRKETTLALLLPPTHRLVIQDHITFLRRNRARLSISTITKCMHMGRSRVCIAYNKWWTSSSLWKLLPRCSILVIRSLVDRRLLYAVLVPGSSPPTASPAFSLSSPDRRCQFPLLSLSPPLIFLLFFNDASDKRPFIYRLGATALLGER